jgi:DNA recombination protein RmuC
MSQMLVAIAIVLAGVAIAAALILARRGTGGDGEVKGQVEMLAAQSAEQMRSLSAQMQQQLAGLRQDFDGRMDGLQRQWQEQNRTIGDRLKESGQALHSVGVSVGKVFEASKKIEELAVDVSRLEDLLKPPKIRGTLGETFLAEALRQVLPSSAFEMPHRFPDGALVDAAIRMGGRWVTIDSKFPLENYRRALEGEEDAERRRARRQFAADVRKHVDAIAAKYIRPADGTFEFALMYVPAEAVYAEIVADSEETALADYALQSKVVPVSPRLLFVYLQTVALGLRGLEIESRAREVMDRIADLTRQWDRVRAPVEILGRHLTNAQKQYEETTRQFERFGDRLVGVSGVEPIETRESPRLFGQVESNEVETPE